MLLERVDLEIECRQTWFVLGHNGSGKTSLVATLLGVLRPFGGEILFGDELAGRRRLGYVPQQPPFDPPLPCTVAEFV
ncbi:MAG: ATP-binding cassette domain-containing protein, partial [Planctomycetota bacterium]